MRIIRKRSLALLLCLLMCLSLFPAPAFAEREIAEDPAVGDSVSDGPQNAEEAQMSADLGEAPAAAPQEASEATVSPNTAEEDEVSALSETGEEDAQLQPLDVNLDPAAVSLLEAAGNRTELASGFCGEEGSNLRWVLYDDGCLLLSGVGAMDKGECPWEAYLESITSVVVSEGVTEIGTAAFNWAVNLTSVELPDSLTNIGGYAFGGCSSLTRITIPAHVSDISVRAFYSSSALSAIDVSADNSTYTSEEGVLFNKAKTELVCCPAGKSGSYSVPAGVSVIRSMAFESCAFSVITLPEGVTVLENYAFAGCSQLAGISLPASLKRMEAYAFKGCSRLEEIDIPAAVMEIGSGCFEDCSALRSISVAQNNAYYRSLDGVLFNKDASRLLSYPIGKSGAYTVPAGTQYIGDGAFFNCSALTEISFPSGLKSIGSFAFNGCNNLAQAVLPAGLTAIEFAAFASCKSMSSVTLAPGVQILGSVFSGCTSLRDVNYGGTQAQRERELWSAENNDAFFQAAWHYLGAEQTIHNFAELRALVNAYDGSSVFAFYNDSDPFVIEESITLPENFFFCADAEGSVLRIPAGVTLTVDSAASNAFYTEKIVLDGALIGRWESIVGEISGSGYWKRSDAYYFFYSEDALREIAAGSFAQWTQVRYGGSDSFRFTRNLVTPPNMQLILENGMVVPDGVQVSISDSFYTTDAVIGGSLLLDYNSANTENRFSSCNSLTVTGSFTVHGKINVYYGELTGRDKITVEGGNADFRRHVNTNGAGEMMDLLTLAGEDTAQHVSYYLYSSVGEEDGYVFELFTDTSIPANTFIQLNGDVLVVDGVMLYNAGKMEFLSPVTVYGGFVNDGYAELHGSETALSIEDGGQYSGSGELAVAANVSSQAALSALLPGLDLDYFAEISSESRASDILWHLRFIAQKVTAQTASLNLDGTIGVNFEMDLSSSMFANPNARAVFIYKGVETSVDFHNMTKNSDGYYFFTYRIPAREFANTISLKFMDGDTIIPMVYPSGKAVAGNVLSYSAETYTHSSYLKPKGRALAQAVQNYCAYAYQYLPKADNQEPQMFDTPDVSTVTASMLDPYKLNLSGQVTGLTITSYYLSLLSSTNVNLELSLAEGHTIGEYTFTLDGNSITPSLTDGSYVLVISNISARGLDTPHELVITHGTESYSVTVFGLSFARTVLNSSRYDSNTELRNLCKAIYLYNDAANTYFGD